MTTDSLPDLERDLIAIVRRAHALGVAEGQRMTLSSFMQFASTALPAAPENAQQGYYPPAERKRPPPEPRQRAPHGQVQIAVRKVIEAHPEGILQGEIISAGASAGFEIKPSSMRMALPALEKAGVIETRDGKWFPKGNGAPQGAPLFNP